MPKYKIERGRTEDVVLVSGEPIGVISRRSHGRVVTCTIEGRRTNGANGECRQGEHPAWLAKRARSAGLVGARRPRRGLGSSPTILYQTANGYITRERTGKSEAYVVWVNDGVASRRKHTVGVTMSDAFERAKAKLDSER